MKKLNLAIIGQGRSGHSIHGAYYRSAANTYYTVRCVAETDAYRREKARRLYPGCEVLDDYRQLLHRRDIDVVVNASFSDMHYAITADLLGHGFNVLTEKPFARTEYECARLMRTAERNGVILAVFQQTMYAPYYRDILRVIDEKRIGDVLQTSIRFNGFARRWDWQTLQKRAGGNAYNTGPHPFCIALGVLGFGDDVRLEFGRLAHTPLSAGDADDYCKAILTAPGRPVADVEISSADAYAGFTVKLQGTRGTFVCTPDKYEYKYISDGDNPTRKLIETPLSDDAGEPAYCGEKLVVHEQQGTYDGTAFDAGTRGLYEDLYYAITEGRPMYADADKARRVIAVIEALHAGNPLPLLF